MCPSALSRFLSIALSFSVHALIHFVKTLLRANYLFS